MINLLVFLVALTGSHLGDGLPIGTTPQTYPHEQSGAHDAFNEPWLLDRGLYTVVPTLALVITAVGLLFGCTWCYRHKDSKLFSTSAVHQQNERRPQPPDCGFSEPANNNISEDNNNGPISLREMQNIANNNAAAYIVSENEERNRTVSRESVVQFEPLPDQLGAAADPLQRCADWFGADDFPRDRLQYLREIGRGWFGRVVEGEMDSGQASVAVKILSPQATLEDKARFLDEAKMYRDLRHDHLLAYVARCLQEDPWILLFELYSMDLQQYLAMNRPNMATLNESGVPLRLQCDVTSAIAYLHAHGYVYGNLWSGNVLVRGSGDAARAVLGRYSDVPAPVPAPVPVPVPAPAPEPHNIHTTSTEVWSLGALLWEVCSWGAPAELPPLPEPALPCPYRAHLYQVMQLCWASPDARPTASQVHSLLWHLLTSQLHADRADEFEERWQRLKPNTIPKLDEHVAIVHAPSTSTAEHFTGSEHELDTLGTMPSSPSAELSRCSSAQAQAHGSLTNLHGSLEDVRAGQPDQLDPWLQDIVAGSQDDVSYYRDVSDVIKNLDNILNSEKTSSSESSHQASPSRDLSLDCNRELPPPQSSLVKSPGISNFQNLLSGYRQEDVEDDRHCDSAGTLSHSFERHSDASSQRTLADLTPDTPLRDVADFVSDLEKRMHPERIGEAIEENVVSRQDEAVDTEKPNEKAISHKEIPKLKELCLESVPRLSEANVEQLNVKEDCKTTCDKIKESVRSDTQESIETKSDEPAIGGQVLVEKSPAGEPVETNEQMGKHHHPENATRVEQAIIETQVIEIPKKSIKDCELFLNNELEHCQNEKAIAIEEICETRDVVLDLAPLPSANSDSQNEASSLSDHVNGENRLIEQSHGSFENLDDEYVLFEDKHESGEDALVDAVNERTHSHNSHELSSAVDMIPHSLESNDMPLEELKDFSESLETHSMDTQSTLPLETPDVIVQTQPNNIESSEVICTKAEDIVKDMKPHDVLSKPEVSVQVACDESTVYMDLINDTNSEIFSKNNCLDNNLWEMMTSIVVPCTDDTTTGCGLIQNDSTVYMDLPNVITEHHQRLTGCLSSQEVAEDAAFKNDIISSTPKSNDPDSTVVDDEPKTPDYGPGVTLTRLEQRFVPDYLSPFDSPTKSHLTDTYDENSSVVLGPFENCTELYKALKSTTGYTESDVPKEELLAFSSNFSDINLETPSPLRDGNFLNEVPDIEDDVQFDDINTISDPDTLEKTEVIAPTNYRGGPWTPPNSPGTFPASTSKYLPDGGNPDFSSLQKEIDLSQIELQMTSKLAMAENENNMNIEYSGPLTVEGLVTDSSEMLRESDSMPEAVLAGDPASKMEAEQFVLNEASMAALRNELELKLPLAQVASIEPSDELPAWGPPELVVNYPGALSPIVEETGHQLSAYENDRVWITSNRTDSSSSYLEPCNNSTDSITELPTAAPSGVTGATYSLHSGVTCNLHSGASCNLHSGASCSVQPDRSTDRDITMSADSLNGSPAKSAKDTSMSPINDRTYTKDDVKESKCDGQESPFFETSVPVHTDGKPSQSLETQGLSKATSIDSWCSNDTLFNVEDNFDDLAMDAEATTDIENEDHSHSTDTLTHHDEDKESSHCSTYIVHDSKSDPCETFSPDSITANCTYTKAKADAEKTPEVITDHNDSSTKNTQTRELAYGTIASGLASYSNCTTEVLTANEGAWKLPQPELVRRSPVAELMNITPPDFGESKDESHDQSPKFEAAHSVKKMDSVEVTCLQDNLMNSSDEAKLSEIQNLTSNNVDDSLDFHCRNMAQSMQSTPLLEPVHEDGSPAISPMQLPNVYDESPSSFAIPNYQAFLNFAELRQQDISQVTALLLEADSRTFSMPTNISRERTPTYSDFEASAAAQPQDVRLKSSSQEFLDFENSIRSRPQDISGIQNICSMLIQSESRSYGMSPGCGSDFDQTCLNSASAMNEQLNHTNNNTSGISSPVESTDLNTAIASTNLSLEMPRIMEPNMSVEDDEQPHSIIVTESPCIKKSAYLTYDSHTESGSLDLNHTYDSHTHRDDNITSKPRQSMDESGSPRFNGEVVDNALEGMALNALNQQIIGPTTQSDQQIVQETQAGTKTANTNVVTADLLNGAVVLESELLHRPIDINNGVQCSGSGANYATVNFINESFEDFFENVDTDNSKADQTELENESSSQKKTVVDNMEINCENTTQTFSGHTTDKICVQSNGDALQSEVNHNGGEEEEGLTSVTETFLQNEKQFSQFGRYLHLMNDIRFTGPTSEIMSTSFCIESPTEPSPQSEGSRSEPNGHSANSGRDVAAEIIKEWDSDSDDSQSSNPSSGEFIWKQRGGPAPRPPAPHDSDGASDAGSGSASGSGSGSGSASGSEGDEVEFVPSSWDCRAAPAKSSLRLSEQASPLHADGKKRVVFKRQKYHCVYEYPREIADVECEAIHHVDQLPDYSTYSEWASAANEEAELSYGQLYGGHPFDMSYPLRAGAGVPFGSDYDEDFFISSSAHPFESLGVMSSSSQFFPGMRLQALKCAPDEPPAPAPVPAPARASLPELGFTTPDSGVEDVTPGELALDHFEAKQLETDASQAACWRAPDSGGSSESVSPSSPGGGGGGGSGEALGGLRHTRDKLKLDLPPSPCVPSPRHSRVFSFVLDKPPPSRAPPEPTFSTFGKPHAPPQPPPPPPEPECAEPAADAGDGAAAVTAEAAEAAVTAASDSGDEDSGIESSAKASLERNKDPPAPAPAPAPAPSTDVKQIL